MRQARSDGELPRLQKQAQGLATQRKETLNSAHLLAALAAGTGDAAALLQERQLDAESLLKAGRACAEEASDALARAFEGARELVRRGASPEPRGIHLLLALLADRRSSAHRALAQAGADLGRLRAAAMQLSLGIVASRRSGQDGAQGAHTQATQAAQATQARRRQGEAPAPRQGRGRAVAVSVSPVPRSGSSSSAAAEAAAPTRSTPPGRLVSLSPSVLPREGKEPAAKAGSTRTDAAGPPSASAPAARAPAQVPSPAEKRPLSPSSPSSSTAATPASPTGAGSRTATPSARPRSEASRFALSREQFPALSVLGRNLTELAARGELEPVVGREEEVERILDILAKRQANSPCLVGPPGVGKTAVAHALAHRFAQAPQGSPGEAVPQVLVELAFSELLAGTGARGALAERMASIRAEVRDARGKVVLFVDGLHELFLGGPAEEAAAELKLGLARGELPLIGAATHEELRRASESDPVGLRRFSLVEVEEPDEEEAFLMLRTASEALARHHGLSYADEALAASIGWSARYLPGRALPDKALGILDLAGARRRRRPSPPGAPPPRVGTTEVAEVLAELADVPMERLLETDRQRMLQLEQLLADKVVGHTPALKKIATILRRNAAGLRGRRPIGSFLLLGPTGVGKTETAKAIAEALFHSPDAMTRLDLSEYAESHAVARLVGAPPGYVGHEAGGQLTEAVRRRPYQVVLLDEIEKAHRDVLEAFLGVFDEGRLTDGRGRRVDFTNTVIVLTSNLGAAEAGAVRSEKRVGFASAQAGAGVDGRAADATLAAAKAALPPELYNRIDEVLCFGSLSRAEVSEIAQRLLAGLAASLEDRDISLEVAPEAIEALLDAGGFEPEYGARPMRRTIARLVEAPLAELLLQGELDRGGTVRVSVRQGSRELTLSALPTRGRAS